MSILIYKQFIEEIMTFLKEGKLNPRITGYNEKEIQELEHRIGKKLPESFKVYLQIIGNNVMGILAGDRLNLDSIKEAYETAQELLNDSICETKCDDYLLPLSQHDGYTFVFIRLDEGDDPPVYNYVEQDPKAENIGVSFTAWLREVVIFNIELNLQNAEICREIAQHRNYWLERKKVLDEYDKRVNKIRNDLIKRVYIQDKQSGIITGPTKFQEIWIQEFKNSDIYQQLKKEGKRMPAIPGLEKRAKSID